jgi:hypothetical protein
MYLHNRNWKKIKTCARIRIEVLVTFFCLLVLELHRLRFESRSLVDYSHFFQNSLTYPLTHFYEMLVTFVKFYSLSFCFCFVIYASCIFWADYTLLFVLYFLFSCLSFLDVHFYLCYGYSFISTPANAI